MRLLLAVFFAAVLSVQTSSMQAGEESNKPSTESFDFGKSLFPPADYERMMDILSETLAATVQPRPGYKVPANRLQTVRAAAKEAVPYKDVVKWCGEVFARHFSKRELEEIATFFRSPTGRKYDESLPAMRQEMNAMTGRLIEERIRAGLKRRGLEAID
jgi:hypothetical protein